jgi:hypothetical protein
VVAIDSAYPADGLLHVPHELGHAMFNLPDDMNQNIPVLGSVNRRWAEEILDLWEGTPRS